MDIFGGGRREYFEVSANQVAKAGGLEEVARMLSRRFAPPLLDTLTQVQTSVSSLTASLSYPELSLSCAAVDPVRRHDAAFCHAGCIIKKMDRTS